MIAEGCHSMQEVCPLLKLGMCGGERQPYLTPVFSASPVYYQETVSAVREFILLSDHRCISDTTLFVCCSKTECAISTNPGVQAQLTINFVLALFDSSWTFQGKLHKSELPIIIHSNKTYWYGRVSNQCSDGRYIRTPDLLNRRRYGHQCYTAVSGLTWNILVRLVQKFLQTFKGSFRAQTMPIKRSKPLVGTQEFPMGVIHASSKSRLSTACPVWDPFSAKDCDILESVQEKSSQSFIDVQNCQWPTVLSQGCIPFKLLAKLL